MKFRRFVLLATVFSVFSALSAPAGEVSLLLQNGFGDGYQFGIGMRAGAILPSRVYLGGRFDWFTGTPNAAWSTEISYFGNLVVRTERGDLKVLGCGAEAGYDLKVPGGARIRPYLGLGMARVSYAAVSSGKLALWPGALLGYEWSRYFAGVDFNYRIVDQLSAGIAAATFGLRF